MLFNQMTDNFEGLIKKYKMFLYNETNYGII
jgi:hypothetical protein